MKPNYLIACLLTVGLPVGAAAGLRAQDTTAQSQAAAPQSVDSQNAAQKPQGYLDPQFSDATDKPHAGTPAQQDASAAAPQGQQQDYSTPEWYKDSPQNYDHGTAKPRRLKAPKGKLQVYDDANPPTRQTAQQEPSQQDLEAQQYGSEPLPQRHIQTPQYYSQPQQQAPQQYAQAPEDNGQQDYGTQQNYPQQNDQQDYAQPDQDQNSGDNYPPDDNNNAPAVQPTQAPLSAQQLEQLVAPLALYPDQLLAQILTASTYPAQITAADQMVKQMKGAAPEQIAQAANAQTAWDPSIKALTAFPQVLAMLDSNLQWTSALGNAYYNQPQDVLQTVQVLRDRAQQAGNLQSTPQEQVVQDQGYTQIQPTNPDVVYVPSYNPWYAYGAPIDPYPSFAFGNWGLYIGGGIDWGLRFAIAPFYGFGFGWGGWGLDWVGCGVLFHDGYYWSHSREMRDWGFRHGGERWGGGGRGWYGRGDHGRDVARFGNYHHEGIRAYPGGSERGPLHNGPGDTRQRGVEPLHGLGHMQGGGPARPEAPRQQAFGRQEPLQGRSEPYGGRSFGSRPQPLQGPRAYPGGSQGFGPRTEPFRNQPQPYRGAPNYQPYQGFRQGNGYGGYPRPGQGFAGRPEPLQNYRPQPQPAPRGFGGGSPGWGRGFAQPQQHPGGGFQSFGHSQPSFGGGGHAFSGGGHAFGGGGGHSFGGGGHSFGGGGGGHFGGGHSFGGGGHSSGGGHDGGHRR